MIYNVCIINWRALFANLLNFDVLLIFQVDIKADQPDGIGWDGDYLREKNLQLNLYLSKLQEENTSEIKKLEEKYQSGMEKLEKMFKDEVLNLQTQMTQMKQEGDKYKEGIEQLRSEMANQRTLLEGKNFLKFSSFQEDSVASCNNNFLRRWKFNGWKH